MSEPKTRILILGAGYGGMRGNTMKIIVFGAMGGTGKQVVEQALGAGNEVTAIARRPSAVILQHERLAVVQGDVFKPSTFESALAGQDVVVSALGVATREPTTLYSQGNANIMRAMQAAGVRRLLCISASGLEPGPRWQRWIAKPLLWFILKNMYTDLVRMETMVKESGLDWTIMRPPMMTNEPRTGQYQVAVNKPLSSGWKISRADLADYIVNHLDDAIIHCALVEIAY